MDSSKPLLYKISGVWGNHEGFDAAVDHRHGAVRFGGGLGGGPDARHAAGTGAGDSGADFLGFLCLRAADLSTDLFENFIIVHLRNWNTAR